MKMRKLLPLVLLAIGAIFLLSSCDAMLDTIYPNNTLNVDVYVTPGTYTDYWVNSGVSPSYVYIVVQGTSQTYSASVVWSGAFDGRGFAYFPASFTSLSNKTYTVYATYYGHSFGGPYYPASYYPGQTVTFAVSSTTGTVEVYF